MKKIKEIANKIYSSVYFPFLVLFIVQLGLNVFKTVGFGDDTWFRDILHNKDILPSGTVTEYIKWRYDTWTSRIIIEVFLVNLLRVNSIIWKVFDVIILTLLGVAISKIFVSENQDVKNTKKLNWIIVFLLFNLPLEMFTGAGWIATFTNYLLPITMGVVALVPLKKVLCNEKIRKYEYLVYIFACLMASNMEQMCAILLVVFFIFSIYCFKEKKKNFIIPILLLIVVLGMINIIICPGNDLRSEAEIKNCYPNFDELSFIDKIALGISAMMQFCLMELNIIYVLFTGLTMFVILKKYEDPIIKIIGIFPFVMGLAFNLLKNVVQAIAPDFTYIFLSIPEKTTLIQSGAFIPLENYMALIIFVITILCMFLSLILVFGKNYKTILAILVLGAGVCSKIMLGFSATVWASGNRTGFVLMISMIITIILILQEQKEKVIDNFLNITMVCGIFSVFEKIIASFSK